VQNSSTGNDGVAGRAEYAYGAQAGRLGTRPEDLAPGRINHANERRAKWGRASLLPSVRGAEMTVHIPPDPLIDFCAEIFARVGCQSEEASRVSASLVDSNLTGHDSHGVIRVPRYVDWVRTGDLIPNQSLERLVDTPVIGVVDGRFGFGQIMAPMAVDIGVEKAKATGLSAISLRNSGHVGRVGEWAERAAAAGLISIHFVNAAGSILVAPFGGMDRRLSTAPFCVGVPRKGSPPIVLDFATSLVAEGKVNVASHGGKPLPLDALIGPDGTLSGDPALLYGPLTPEGPRDHHLGTGAIRAFGEHKGSGLALLCELLGGSLTGNGATEPDRKFSNGMFSLYVDPEQVDPSHVFDADMTRYLDWFQQAKAVPGGAVLTPGEPERAARAKRAKTGVPLPEEAWASIVAAARSVGVNRDIAF
jgi:hydroxycarboxylate dehydrogenase B